MDPTLASALATKYGLLESQTAHRLQILSYFSIPPASSVLEIGCGQGDFTAVLARHVSTSVEDTDKGHIDAVDPAPLDYGAPETLGQAQARMKSTNIGQYVDFHCADPVQFMSSTGVKGERDGEATHDFDFAVLCHSLWYFRTKAEIARTLSAARGRCKQLCIAEWALTTGPAGTQSQSAVTAYPHVLAALTRATCEAHIPNSDQNIRTPVSPAGIKELAAEAGWNLKGEHSITPVESLDDARWEIGMLLQQDEDGDSAFLKRARAHIKEEPVIILLESMLESVKSAVTAAGGVDHVKCMNVWVAAFA